MTIPRWNPPQELTTQEKFLLKRLARVKKLFGFLRLHRHELFDATFQNELEGMYRESGAGKQPKAPAMLAMVLLLQAYSKISDAEAVEMSVVDLRWQMVLGCLGSSEPAFSQGALQEFRQRLIDHDMDQRLLERTVELAKRTDGFDWKKMPKDLRVVVDSRPFEGAGRVEDTFNLLGHVTRKLAETAAVLMGWDVETLCKEAGATLLLASSIKAGLDVDWSNEEQEAAALVRLDKQISALLDFLRTRPEIHGATPLRPILESLGQFWRQDLELNAKGEVGIRQGVTRDRRISVEDADMRHGRKSKSRLFNGYKCHLGVDMDSGLIVTCAVTPANQPDHVALAAMNEDIESQGKQIGTMSSDLAYLASPVVKEVLERGGDILCKPRPHVHPDGRFSKDDFDINLRTRVITCPAGEERKFTFGETIHFDADACDRCSLRRQCTGAARGHGRSIHIAEDEALQKRLRRRAATRAGRAALRERTLVEHKLAHHAGKQGRKARYRGLRKNLFDARRHAAVLNLETTHLSSKAA